MPRQVGGAIEDLTRSFVEQVDPLGVHALDQADLPQSPPFLRPQYAADYYGAFVRDPDGNKLHFVRRGD